MGCSTATQAAHQPKELLKYKSTQPRSETCSITLYNVPLFEAKQRSYSYPSRGSPTIILLYSITHTLQVPKTHCPDVLTLGLIQINPPLTNFRTEVLAQMLQIFLANHPNSGVILNYAWHSNTLNLKGVVMHAMGEWYRNSQVRFRKFQLVQKGITT